jgi:hypothetical protein
MSRKVGQITARGERRWLIRVYLGRDRETRKRTYHNRTIYGSLGQAQAYLTRKLHERDLSRGVEGLQVTVDEFLDHWLKTAVRPKVRGKTYSDYAAMLRRYIRPIIGAKLLATLSPLEIQAVYQVMIDRAIAAARGAVLRRRACEQLPLPAMRLFWLTGPQVYRTSDLCFGLVFGSGGVTFSEVIDVACSTGFTPRIELKPRFAASSLRRRPSDSG